MLLSKEETRNFNNKAENRCIFISVNCLTHNELKAFFGKTVLPQAKINVFDIFWSGKSLKGTWSEEKHTFDIGIFILRFSSL